MNEAVFVMIKRFLLSKVILFKSSDFLGFIALENNSQGFQEMLQEKILTSSIFHGEINALKLQQAQEWREARRRASYELLTVKEGDKTAFVFDDERNCKHLLKLPKEAIWTKSYISYSFSLECIQKKKLNVLIFTLK